MENSNSIPPVSSEDKVETEQTEQQIHVFQVQPNPTTTTTVQPTEAAAEDELEHYPLMNDSYFELNGELMEVNPIQHDGQITTVKIIMESNNNAESAHVDHNEGEHVIVDGEVDTPNEDPSPLDDDDADVEIQYENYSDLRTFLDTFGTIENFQAKVNKSMSTSTATSSPQENEGGVTKTTRFRYNVNTGMDPTNVLRPKVEKRKLNIMEYIKNVGIAADITLTKDIVQHHPRMGQVHHIVNNGHHYGPPKRGRPYKVIEVDGLRDWEEEYYGVKLEKKTEPDYSSRGRRIIRSTRLDL